MLIPTSGLISPPFLLKCVTDLNGNVAASWHEEEEDSEGMKRKTNEDKIMTTKHTKSAKIMPILLYMTAF